MVVTTKMRLTFDDDNDGDRIITNDSTRSRPPKTQHIRGLWLVIVIVCLVSLVSSATGQQFEGSSCRTRNGTLGICKIHRHCMWAMRGYQERSFGIADMVRCGFLGRDELICCLDEMPDQGTTESPDTFLFDDELPNTRPSSTTARPVPVTTPPPSRITERRSVTECARFVQMYSTLTFHILGGVATNPGDFPHMAALGYPDFDANESIAWNCGGSLVSENFVLTAAHCLTRSQPTVVRLGQVNLTPDTVDGAEEIPIAETIMHPDYRSNRVYHDIALVRLARNATMNELVYPACLRNSVADVPNESFLLTGWGDTSVERREKSNVLLRTNVTAVELSACNLTYAEQPRNRRWPNLLDAGMICAHDVRGINDACQGDSGGPLQVIRPDNFASIVGITSFGISCGSAVPSVYARVAFYLNWLESVIWPN